MLVEPVRVLQHRLLIGHALVRHKTRAVVGHKRRQLRVLQIEVLRGRAVVADVHDGLVVHTLDNKGGAFVGVHGRGLGGAVNTVIMLEFLDREVGTSESEDKGKGWLLLQCQLLVGGAKEVVKLQMETSRALQIC